VNDVCVTEAHSSLPNTHIMRRACNIVALLALLVVLWRVIQFPLDPGIVGKPTLTSPEPRDEPGARYAVVTSLSWSEYDVPAMTLCWSLRRSSEEWPTDVDIVAIVTRRDSGESAPDEELLSRCFHRVVSASSVLGTPPGNGDRGFTGSLDSLLVFELLEYRRVAYMEADLMAVRPRVILDMLRTPVRFAGVSGIFPEVWQGGFFVVEPSEEIAAWTHEIVEEGKPVTNEDVLTRIFPTKGDAAEGVFALPVTFDLEPLYPSVWGSMDEAVAIHFSMRKPWLTVVCSDRGAYARWRRVRAEAAERYGFRENDEWSLGHVGVEISLAASGRGCGP